MVKDPLYKKLLGAVVAYQNCQENNNQEWSKKWQEKIVEYEKMLPLNSGGSFTHLCSVDFDNTNKDVLVLDCSHHYYNNAGYSEGWMEFKVAVRPSLLFDIEIEFVWFERPHRSFGDLEEYFEDLFQHGLTELVE